ncbi:hypothetical protein HW932_21370 [Allochromatium humboldtianum]|uniref:Uncharacterized protein n=1 Tax=Allochromatium humboldtianum TaxID=504901 RepID=A0A850RJW8_9GAMM|nr:hypothetical protein [Allochromatium humboldtianum]NVZ11797.1 hypothetical protein [Allochromatium humboldtianum]
MPPLPADTLLDPKNDYVFFRVFSEEPDLLVDLINVVRRDEPPITEVKLLNPRLTPERLSGKHPERWSGPTRNWTPITVVSLNPERDIEHTPLDRAV